MNKRTIIPALQIRRSMRSVNVRIFLVSSRTDARDARSMGTNVMATRGDIALTEAITDSALVIERPVKSM